MIKASNQKPPKSGAMVILRTVCPPRPCDTNGLGVPWNMAFSRTNLSSRIPDPRNGGDRNASLHALFRNSRLRDGVFHLHYDGEWKSNAFLREVCAGPDHLEACGSRGRSLLSEEPDLRVPCEENVLPFLNGKQVLP